MKPAILHKIPGFEDLPHDMRKALTELETNGVGVLVPKGFLTLREISGREWDHSDFHNFADYPFDFELMVNWSQGFLVDRARPYIDSQTQGIDSHFLKNRLECEARFAFEGAELHPIHGNFIHQGAAILAATLAGLTVTRNSPEKSSAQIVCRTILTRHPSCWRGHKTEIAEPWV
jgi:hypothetical protein